MYTTGLEEVPPKATLPEGIQDDDDNEDVEVGQPNVDELPMVQTRRNPLCPVVVPGAMT